MVSFHVWSVQELIRNILVALSSGEDDWRLFAKQENIFAADKVDLEEFLKAYEDRC